MKTLKLLCLCGAVSLTVNSLSAAVSLPAIFSDHAVLQKAADTPVWGRAAAGERVTVTLGEVSAQTTADADGKWRVSLDLGAAGAGPFTLTVSGENTLTVSDVLVGEVWLCGGQSNMEFPLARAADAEKEIAAAGGVPLRQFTVSRVTPLTPADDCAGAWLVAAPNTAGKFTAAGWFFGKRVAAETGAPVGLIASYWGGTAIEPWTSASGLDGDAELKALKDRKLDLLINEEKYAAEFLRRYQAWTEQYARQDRRASAAEFAAADVDTAAWRKVKMPALFADVGLPDAGAVWLRRVVKLPVPPANLATQSGVTLDFNKVWQFDEVYVNGVKIGGTTPAATSYASRSYPVPAGLLRDGDNVLAIRVLAPAGGGGLTDPKALFRLRLTDSAVELAGEWLAKVEQELPPLTETARAEYPVQPEKPTLRSCPTLLFNGMIHPLIPYGLRGVIWYQGESNVDRAAQYHTAFTLLIKDWRARWGRGDFPFYFCQLANYRGIQREPGDSPWAELREAQARTLAVPGTGMAVLIDIGEEWDIHPRNKSDVGERLARIALHDTYGKKEVEFSGPRFESVSFSDGRAVVKFTHADGGLVAKPLPAEYQPVTAKPQKSPLVRNTPDSEVEGFAVCGEDRQWHWAEARVAGDSVIVSASGVARPVAVRYAWGNNPLCNLYNRAGLPAVPFRTDDFPSTR